MVLVSVCSCKPQPVPADDALEYYYDDYPASDDQEDNDSVGGSGDPIIAAASSSAVDYKPATGSDSNPRKDGLASLVGLVSDVGVGVISHLTGKVTALRETLDSKDVQDRIDDVVEVKAAVAENVAQVAQPIIRHTVEKVPKLIGATLQLLDNLLQNKGLRQAHERFVDGSKNIAKNIERRISDVAEGGDKLTQSLVGAGQATAPVIAQGLQDIKDQAPVYTRLASSVVGVYTEQLKEVLDTFGSSFHCSFRCRDLLGEAKKECDTRYKCPSTKSKTEYQLTPRIQQAQENKEVEEKKEDTSGDSALEIK